MVTLGYLQVHQNPSAPVRADGRRYHGYPQRTAQTRLIGIHTAESIPDYTPPVDAGAENVARYLASTSRAASYHEVGDSDSWVTLLPPEAVAFGARGWNTTVWHWSFATQAYRWPNKPEAWKDPALRIAADRCSIVARANGIPPVRITLAQARAGVRGFIDHARLDPARRTDPGAGFPWDRFLALVAQRLRPQPKPPVIVGGIRVPALIRNKASGAVQYIDEHAAHRVYETPDREALEAQIGPTAALSQELYERIRGAAPKRTERA